MTGEGTRREQVSIVCGITGVFALHGKPRVEQHVLESMTAKLEHRGPDDSGYHLAPGVGFGFRRLSIIDLAHGQQPQSNEDQTVTSVCNGEIFNHEQLKSELRAQGHRFRSRSDVECLVHLYEEHGPGFLSGLNGQFAMAIHDARSNTLLLARDQLGILPLFYAIADGLLIFGSEIKAILEHPAIRREVDLTGLDQILTFPGPVSPRTMFRNIQSLPPGHCLIVENGEVEVREYWDLDFPLMDSVAPIADEAYHVHRLDQLLRESVDLRLGADVPVGFYLSGGLDSSLIGSMIHDLRPEDSWQSFSIGFDQDDIDERAFQQLMSDHVGSTHHEILFDWPDISSRLKKAVYQAECALKESYNCCSLALSEMVSSRGIKVILTGEGADEIFGGYVGYRFDAIRKAQEEESFDPQVFLEREVRERLWGDADFFYERNFLEFGEIKSALYAPDIAASLDAFRSESQPLIDVSKVRGRHPLHKRSYIDLKLRLSDHLLADHGDRVALANAVEARYPFLDVGLLEYAKDIPVELLLRGDMEKYILRRVASRYLPEAIVQRKKFGFVAPGSPYLLKQDIEWITDLLAYDKIKREGYFNADTVERLKKLYLRDDFSINQTFDNDLLMVVLTFEIFLEVFDMPAADSLRAPAFRRVSGANA